MVKTIIPTDSSFYSVNSDNVVLLNYDNDMYFGLDSIGSEYWELIQKNKEFNLVIESMLYKYPDVSRETLESDLNELILQLETQGLVKVVNDD